MQHEHMMQKENAAEAERLDARLTRVLEQAPAAAVPDGFASRLMAELPERAAGPKVRRPSFALVFAAASLVVMLAAMFWLAPRAAGHANYWTAFEWLLCAQFCVSAAWLGLRAIPGE